MNFFRVRFFRPVRSLGTAGLLAVLVGCGASPTTPPEPPATAPARPACT
jgi:hypothetical protein